MEHRYHVYPAALWFVYLVAVMNWYGRYVLSWELSNTLDGQFCLAALGQALTYGTPEIFNTDQGRQFTTQAFTDRLEQAQIRVSMDGRGRALDNVFLERLWRTVKYEEEYLHDYATVLDLERSLEYYFQFYNRERLHQSLTMECLLEYITGPSDRENTAPALTYSAPFVV